MNTSDPEKNNNPNLSVEIIRKAPYLVVIKMILNNSIDNTVEIQPDPEETSMQNSQANTPMSPAMEGKNTLMDNLTPSEE